MFLLLAKLGESVVENVLVSLQHILNFWEKQEVSVTLVHLRMLDT